jgi:hypothetical protein
MFEHKIKDGVLTLCIVKSEDRKAAINAAVKRAVEFQEMGFSPEITNVDAESWALVDDVQNWQKATVQ